MLRRLLIKFVAAHVLQNCPKPILQKFPSAVREKLTPLGIMGAQLKDAFQPFGVILL